MQALTLIPTYAYVCACVLSIAFAYGYSSNFDDRVNVVVKLRQQAAKYSKLSKLCYAGTYPQPQQRSYIHAYTDMHTCMHIWNARLQLVGSRKSKIRHERKLYCNACCGMDRKNRTFCRYALQATCLYVCVRALQNEVPMHIHICNYVYVSTIYLCLKGKLVIWFEG